MKELIIIAAVESLSPGYVERLKRVNGELRGQVARLENRIASADETTRSYWVMIQNGVAEVRQLKEQVEGFERMDRYYADIERQNEQLQEQVLTLGAQNTALAAWAENAELLEQQLAAADERIKELEAALVVARLPAGSRDNVIQMVREAA